jgi:hypothetical protein
MKCEVKMFTKDFKGFLIDTIIHPKQNALIWIKAACIAVPVLIVNKLFTPESKYIVVGVLLVCVLSIYILCHRDCKNIKTQE